LKRTEKPVLFFEAYTHTDKPEIRISGVKPLSSSSAWWRCCLHVSVWQSHMEQVTRNFKQKNTQKSLLGH